MSANPWLAFSTLAYEASNRYEDSDAHFTMCRIVKRAEFNSFEGTNFPASSNSLLLYVNVLHQIMGRTQICVVLTPFPCFRLLQRKQMVWRTFSLSALSKQKQLQRQQQTLQK